MTEHDELRIGEFEESSPGLCKMSLGASDAPSASSSTVSDDSVPPTDRPEDKGDVSLGTSPFVSHLQDGRHGDVPWDCDDSDLDGDVPWDCDDSDLDEDADEEDKPPAEIYRKAENFSKLHLFECNSLSEADLMKYIKQNYGSRGVSRAGLGKFVMTKLGFRVANDVLHMLSCTKGAQIVIATAGAGKTTSLQFNLIVSKMMDKTLKEDKLKPMCIEGTTVSVPRVLYLNYNKHNVQPIVDRHVAMCKAVSKFLNKEDEIDSAIDSTTVHAFCHRWLTAISETVKLPTLEIMNDTTKEEIWTAVIKPRWKKFYRDDVAPVDFSVMDELYVYRTESMLDWDEFFESAKFVDTGLKADFVKSCLKKYDGLKKSLGVIDFTDYLILMVEVLKEHEDFRKKLQEQYSIIVADENQDFTKLMNELLIQLYAPGVNRLIVVGDPDQTIYAFKGVSPDNIVDLYARLDDVVLLGLDINYRCPDRIVDAAKAILDLNILRFKKPIETIKAGGNIFTHPVPNGERQDVAVLQLLKRIPESEYGSTVITYRNNISSVIVAEELYYAGIPFQSIDSRRPFSNSVFKHITRCLRALQEKDNFELNKELYRFLPLSKELWFKILDYNKGHRHLHIQDIEVPATQLPASAMNALRTLIAISEQIDTQPVCDYIGALEKLYRTYYFDYIVYQNSVHISEVDSYELYLERTMKFYSRQMTFDFMMREHSERNRDNANGVTLSTFHGLKGLEFNYVIAIDFSESIFPNYYSIEQKYSLNTAMEEKESENRLCYVLVTRAIKEFHMFYLATDPSVYVGVLTKGHWDVGTDKQPVKELILSSVSGPSGADSKMDFVQRLLENRR